MCQCNFQKEDFLCVNCYMVDNVKRDAIIVLNGNSLCSYCLDEAKREINKNKE